MAFLIDRFTSRPLVAVIRLEGVIASGGRIGSSTLNDVTLAPLIERTFTRGKPKAVALVINSPGGSPVQSALIAARIRRLADEKKLPVYAFCEDVAASGGYWLATAADQIFVDANSIVGSIGVISAGFGLNEFITRHGIERRIYTAGEDKSMLDPFRPEREADVGRLMEIQKIVHDNFIAQVSARRDGRLKEDNLFNGDIFVGPRAVETGLADGIGHLVPKMKEVFGDKTRFVQTQPKRGLLRRLGAPGVRDVVGAIEDRLVWSRFGL